jgi:hypothetical protein
MGNSNRSQNSLYTKDERGTQRDNIRATKNQVIHGKILNSNKNASKQSLNTNPTNSMKNMLQDGK